MKKHLKLTLILTMIIVCIVTMCLPVSATAGWAEMDEESERTISVAFIILILLFWPLILIETICIALQHLITGTVAYTSIFPSFVYEITGRVFAYVVHLVDFFLNK